VQDWGRRTGGAFTALPKMVGNNGLVGGNFVRVISLSRQRRRRGAQPFCVLFNGSWQATREQSRRLFTRSMPHHVAAGRARDWG